MVCDSFRSHITTSPAAVNRRTDLIFGMYMDIGDRMPVFGKSWSKVKGQGQISTKNTFRPSVTTSLAAANRPTDLIFGMYTDIGDQMPVFE